MHVHCSAINSSQDMEATEMSIERRMDKDDGVHIYSGILLSHKMNEIMPFAATRMALEIIILSKPDKDKYHIILLICGILKNNTNELIKK